PHRPTCLLALQSPLSTCYSLPSPQLHWYAPSQVRYPNFPFPPDTSCVYAQRKSLYLQCRSLAETCNPQVHCVTFSSPAEHILTLQTDPQSALHRTASDVANPRFAHLQTFVPP